MDALPGTWEEDYPKLQALQRYRAAKRAFAELTSWSDEMLWLDSLAGNIDDAALRSALLEGAQALPPDALADRDEFGRRRCVRALPHLAAFPATIRQKLVALADAVHGRRPRMGLDPMTLARAQGSLRRWYATDPTRLAAAEAIVGEIQRAAPRPAVLAAQLNVLGEEPLPTDEGVRMQAWGVVDVLRSPTTPARLSELAAAHHGLVEITGTRSLPAALRAGQRSERRLTNPRIRPSTTVPGGLPGLRRRA